MKNKNNISRRDAIKCAGTMAIGTAGMLVGGIGLNACNENKKNNSLINNNQNYMKVLMINGSPNEKGCTFTALSEVASSLEKNEIKTEIM